MNFRNVWLFLLVTICAALSAHAQVVVGQTHSIRSTVLNEDRNYRISLPESYTWAKDRRYPVLYVLDGESQFLHSAVSAGYLAKHGEIPEMIVVGIDSNVRIRDYTQTDWREAWAGGGGAVNFKKFLSAEFIPAIEQTYRTDGFRVLSGHSAAGQFALYCLTSEPSLFRAYIALSPSLDWDHNLPQRSLEKSFAATRNLEAFLYVARSDDAGRALVDYKRLVQTLKTKSPTGLRWFSQAFPNETHSSVPLLAQIDALRHLYFGYRFHDDMMGKGFAYAEQHFRKVSKTVGWQLALPQGVINEFAYEALAQGKTQEAIGLFKRNVEASPNSADAWGSLADGYAKAGNWKDAVQASERAVAVATEFARPNLSYFVGQAKKMNQQRNQVTAPSQ